MRDIKNKIMLFGAVLVIVWVDPGHATRSVLSLPTSSEIAVTFSYPAMPRSTSRISKQWRWRRDTCDKIQGVL